jgi:geranylgeranyl pyrophosphate synthase
LRGGSEKRKKKTFPVILVFENADSAQKMLLTKIYKQANPELSNKETGEIIKIIDELKIKKKKER